MPVDMAAIKAFTPITGKNIISHLLTTHAVFVLVFFDPQNLHLAGALELSLARVFHVLLQLLQ